MQKLSKILCGLALTTMVSASMPQFDLASSGDFKLTTIEGENVTAKILISGETPKDITTKYKPFNEVDQKDIPAKNVWIVEQSANGSFVVNNDKSITFTPSSPYWSGTIDSGDNKGGFAIMATDSDNVFIKKYLNVEVQPIGFFGGLWKSVWDPAWGVSKVIYEVQLSPIFQGNFFGGLWQSVKQTRLIFGK